MDIKTLLFSPLGQWVLALVVVGALALLSRLALKGSALLHAQVAKAESDHKSTVQLMLLRVSDAIAKSAADAVSHIEETLRPQILGAAKDGKLDANQAKLLKDAAVKLAMDQLHVMFGRALEQVGITGLEALAPTVDHMVTIAAEKIAGNSRMTVVDPDVYTTPTLVPDHGHGAVTTQPSEPLTKTTTLTGEPVPQ